MRELNRHFENGGQWTHAGAENLLQWHQIYRNDSKRWGGWFPDSVPAKGSRIKTPEPVCTRSEGESGRKRESLFGGLMFSRDTVGEAAKWCSNESL
jgi:hypothetical protein